MRNFFRKSSKVTAETHAGQPVSVHLSSACLGRTPAPQRQKSYAASFVFLEDRRVLCNPFDMETEAEVGHSIHQIREEGTKTLQALSADAFPVVLFARSVKRGDGSMMSSTRIIAISIISGLGAMPVRPSLWRWERSGQPQSTQWRRWQVATGSMSKARWRPSSRPLGRRHSWLTSSNGLRHRTFHRPCWLS